MGPCSIAVGRTVRSAYWRGQRRHLVTQVFDLQLKLHHRERAASASDYGSYSYLHDEVADRLVERLDDIHESYLFNEVVDLGSGSGSVRRALLGRGVKRLLELDAAPAMLEWSASEQAESTASGTPPQFEVSRRRLECEIADLEPESTDLIVSSMALHWVNDIPGALAAAKRALRPNGLFLAAFLGGETLAEMRSSFVLADLERHGGVSQHMSPLVSVANAGALLQAAGFALPTVDTETISINYPDAWTLWHHLRAMGESRATLGRSPSSLATLLAAASAYRECYGHANSNTVPATFQVIYLIGWSPHDSQQRPLPRGAGKGMDSISLKELGLESLEGKWHPTDDSASGSKNIKI